MSDATSVRFRGQVVVDPKLETATMRDKLHRTGGSNGSVPRTFRRQTNYPPILLTWRIGWNLRSQIRLRDPRLPMQTALHEASLIFPT
jgi:hypothetical protein